MKKFSFLLILLLLFVPLAHSQQAQEVSIAPLDYGIKQTIVTISNTATAIPTTALKGRKTLLIKNLSSSVTVYIGSSTVTANEENTGGFPLQYQESLSVDLGENTTLYGICASSAKVSILEVR